MIVVGSREESACMEREGQALHDQGRKNGNSLPFFFSWGWGGLWKWHGGRKMVICLSSSRVNFLFLWN